MLTADFDYDLPEELIAQRPAAPGGSRLMVPAAAQPHRRVDELPELLRAGDLLVVNDTRVIPARLHARRLPGGGRLELLLTEKRGPRQWEALVKPGRRAKPGTRLELDDRLAAEVVSVTDDGRRRLETDRRRYQTVFARHPGAIAAPTAGWRWAPPWRGRSKASPRPTEQCRPATAGRRYSSTPPTASGRSTCC